MRKKRKAWENKRKTKENIRKREKHEKNKRNKRNAIERDENKREFQ